ncbi:ABC transporter permease [Aminipila terrae]|uniref:FtsX-like permease family protein n=1 Tax=Aminipila terrae TaxID=2697030 RepID=A0A6P1MNE1_9FIRM|nr:ABC transporter permease [Aminipila terrae]QHI72525.1 FtsX-like permease family protein [Aminipila terrae]
MLKVKNAKTINNLALKSFQSNKLRNVFVIIAITLTTILFTSVFTIGSSLIGSLQESTMRQVGSSAHGTYKNLTPDEYKKISKNKSIENIGYSVVLGYAENKELVKRPSEIRYTSSAWQAKSMFALPTSGRLPKAANEIAADDIVLKSLGIPCELGQHVTLEYLIDNKKITDTFTLVGFWKEDSVIPASEIWLSPAYVKNKLIGYRGYNIYGTINADVTFKNSFFIESKMQKVVSESGLPIDEIKYGVNWAYAGHGGSTDLTTILSVSGMIGLIILSGYLIISNIFYISIVKDIQYYGLLKAVGTTSRQIRKIIGKQAGILCCIGIPIGLAAGFLVGKVLTPVVLSSFNLITIIIPINPAIFIGAAMFSAITVYISIRKPSRIAAKVSAIEALRNSDNTIKVHKKIKKSKKISPFRMAKENVFRNRKKMIMVTVSLSLSLIILNCAYSIVKGFDMDKYLSNSMVKDFAVADAAYFNVYKCYRGEQTLNKEFLKELYSQEGIKETGNIYFCQINYNIDDKIKSAVKEATSRFNMSEKKSLVFKDKIAQKDFQVQLYGLDDSIFEELTCFKGNIDKDKFKTGKYIIASAFDSEGRISYYKIGDKVTIKYPKGNSQEYEVMAIANIPYPISVRYGDIIDVEFLLPSEEFCKNMGDLAPMMTTFDANEKEKKSIENYLDYYCNKVNTDMQYTSKATFAAEFEEVKQTYFSVGIVISSILAFIGIINFINTTITSLIARKRELAMLQSIGMTSRQMKQMIISEGLTYVCLTALTVLIVGSPIGYLGISATMCNNIAFTPIFTVVPSLLCLPVFVVLVYIITLSSYKVLNKKSIVERLREIE